VAPKSEPPDTRDGYELALTSIHLLNPSYGWTVGYNHESYEGYTFRWNGFDWEYVASTGSNLKDVFVVSENDVWTVGDDGVICHWDGIQWNDVFSGTSTDLHSISMVSADDGWIVGDNGIILHWNGIQWTPIEAPDDTYSLSSVQVISANDVWAVGKTSTQGLVIHWDGIEWTTQYVLVGWNVILYDIFMLNSDEGWAGGHYGKILHWHETDETGPNMQYVSQDPLPHAVNYTDVVQVEALVTDISGVKQVTLKYTDDDAWTSVNMVEVGEDLYRGEIEPFPELTTVTYLIIAEDNIGNIATTDDYQYTVALELNEPPIATLDVSKNNPEINETITLDASLSYDPDGQVEYYFFDFGDGQDSGWTSFSVTSHSYEVDGTY